MIGWLRGDPLVLVEEYLNDAPRNSRTFLQKYIKTKQRCLMSIAAKNNFPLLNQYNIKGHHCLREHIATLGEVFKMLEAFGDPAP